MPHCPLCASTHIVISMRTKRWGYCHRCDLKWALDAPPAQGSAQFRTLPEGAGEPTLVAACGARST